MSAFPSLLKRGLRSPMLPLWLVVALLPFGRSAELGTVFCCIGALLFFLRFPQALRQHAGARLWLALMACYIGAALLSAVDALMPGKSWSTVAGLLRYIPLGLYACFAIRRESLLHKFYMAVGVVIGLWTLDAWMQALTGWSLAGRASPERISGIFGADDLKLGPTLAVLSPFVLWAARQCWGLKGLVVAALLVAVPVLLAGERAGWICYALVLLAFAWHEAQTWRRFVAFAGIAVLAAVIVGGVAWKTSADFDLRMQRTLAVFEGTSQGLNQALTGRLDIWRTSVHMIAAHPINGVGVRGFRYAYPHYAPADDHFVVSAEACGVGEGACHAHQLVLEILTETGALGLLCWLVGVVLAFRFWWRQGAQARRRAFPVSVALGVMLFPLNSHLAFYSAWWGLLFAWLLGLWCAALMVRPQEDEHAA